MSAACVLGGIALVAFSGVPGLFAARGSPRGERLAAALLVGGSVVGALGAASALAGWTSEVMDLPWRVPGGRLALRIDPIAAMFLLQLFLISSLGSLYGLGYWSQAEHPTNAKKLRLFYGWVSAGIALLIAASNGVLFLAGWEVMALSAFLLVTTEDEVPAVRDAGLVYLVTTRAGTLCLFAFFALSAAVSSGIGFGFPLGVTGRSADALFLLAVAGFGLKAGLMPLHLWLPGAHANAPSHVSAVMSGVLIKTGIYALVRFLSAFPSPPVWWGVTLFGLGAASGVLGVAFAIAQHDLKRLLAYHSVENIGIIVMGVGLAVLGRSLGRADLVVLGMASALLHVWNHGLFKALLFLGAGSVLHATGEREIDRLGGLARRMPWTSAAFLVGAVAICGLPPLNGFVSELFLYLGLFRCVVSDARPAWLTGTFGAPVLALIGALAAACFVKAFGATFLGTPRTAAVDRAHESPRAMLMPLGVLAFACAVIGLAPSLVAPILDRAVGAWAPELSRAPALGSLVPFAWISAGSGGLVALVGAVAVGAGALANPQPLAAAGTWDCGYAQPRSSMQYTSSSFAQMLVGIFRWALRPDEHRPSVRGPFPAAKHFHSHVPDLALDRVVRPVVRNVARVFAWFRWVQQGSLHAYLFYILLALFVGLFGWR